jgi:predicted permease
LGWIDTLRADVRFALRYFRRKPLSSATIVLILGLGIGGSSFQLSMLLSLTTRPPSGLPEDLPLVRLRGMYRAKDAPEWRDRTLWYSEVREVGDVPNAFAGIAGWTMSRVVANTRGGDDATLWAQFVTKDFFRVIGVRPTHGPGLRDVDDGTQPAGVISYALWEDMFDRGEVAGQVVMLNGIAVHVVGVAPPQFTGALSVDNRRMMWLPLSSRATILGLAASNPAANLDSANFQAVGVLRPGISPERATATARVVTARVVARMSAPATSPASAPYVFDSDVVPLRGFTSIKSDLPLIFAAWAVLAALVIAVVCTNVGGLTISASVSRRHEIAVRLSLGASRARVIRQLLTESVLLAFAGAALGLVLYLAVIAAAARIPESQYVRLDFPTVGLTMLLALGTGILFGLTPAFHATRHGVAEVLKTADAASTGRSRLHQAFVVAQVLLVQPLLVLIASLLGTLVTHDRAELPSGVPDHVLQVSIDVDAMPGTNAEKTAALRRLVARLGQTPGVVNVLPNPEPLRSATLSVRAEDRGALARASDPIQVDMLLSTAGYFDLVGAPLLRGDDRPPADTGWTTIISSDLARALWGNADPIGRRFTQISPVISVRRDLVVTGVYDSRRLPSGTTSARIYRSVKDWRANRYLVRTAGPGADFASVVRRIAREELPSTPFDPPVTLAQIDEREQSGMRTTRIAAGSVATLVLLLASIGLYGIVALSVGQRRREIGVRMALGARATQVVGLFYRSGLKLGALGLVLGLPISLVAARMLPALAQQAGESDAHAPNLLIIGSMVAVVVLIVASIATLIPATRAATVNPVTALRTD